MSPWLVLYDTNVLRNLFIEEGRGRFGRGEPKVLAPISPTLKAP